MDVYTVCTALEILNLQDIFIQWIPHNKSRVLVINEFKSHGSFK